MRNKDELRRKLESVAGTPEQRASTAAEDAQRETEQREALARDWDRTADLIRDEVERWNADQLKRTVIRLAFTPENVENHVGGGKVSVSQGEGVNFFVSLSIRMKPDGEVSFTMIDNANHAFDQNPRTLDVAEIEDITIEKQIHRYMDFITD